MRHCERVQNMARTYLDLNPGDETASAAMRDAAMLYTRFAAGRAKSREMLSALSQKIMPKDLQRITTDAVETVRAALNYPNALTVTVHPYFAPCKVGNRTVDAMVFNVYLTAYPQPMGGAPDYQQFLLSQATLGDTSVYLTVVDRTNENATTQPVKVGGPGAGKKILGYLKGWGNLSLATTTKMAAPSRTPPPKVDYLAAITSALKGMKLGPVGGRVVNVDYHRGASPSWSVEPSNLTPMAHYVGDSYYKDRDDDESDDGGWDSDAWDRDYAFPVKTAAITWLVREFDSDLFYVQVSEKGHLDIQLTAQGIKKFLA